MEKGRLTRWRSCEREARPVPSWADADPNACCQSNNTARQGVDKIATERIAPAEVEARADVMLDWEWKKEIGQEGTMTYGRASERVFKWAIGQDDDHGI